MFSGQPRFASSTQVPDPREILDLQIKRGSQEAVPIFFDFNPGKIIGWSNRVDEELSDGGFANCLERAGILKSVAISKNLEGFRDAKGLRHLVCCWSPSLHIFFFSIGELTLLWRAWLTISSSLCLVMRTPSTSSSLPRISRLRSNFQEFW